MDTVAPEPRNSGAHNLRRAEGGGRIVAQSTATAVASLAQLNELLESVTPGGGVPYEL